MSQQLSNVKSQSKEGDNIFDTYITTIEKIKLRESSQEQTTIYDYLTNAIAIIERNLVDIAQNKDIKKKELKLKNNVIEQILKAWLPLLEEYGSISEFIKGLAYNFLGSSLIINNQLLTTEEINSLASYFYPTFEMSQSIVNETDLQFELEFLHKKISKIYAQKERDLWLTLSRQLRRFNKIQNLFYHSKVDDLFFKITNQFQKKAFKFAVEVLENDTSIEEIRFDSKDFSVIDLLEDYFINSEGQISYEWLLSFQTDEDAPDANEFLSVINTFITGIKLIDEDGIEITLVDWGNGSKWANFKIRFNSYLSKEETKEILEKATKAAHAELFDKRIGESTKVNAEAAKITRETENLIDKEDAHELNRLEIQLKKLSVFEKEVDIQQKVEDLKTKKIDNAYKISEMIKNGIFGDSNIRIEINNILYVDTTNDSLEIGENLNLLDGHTVIRPNNKEKDDKEQTT